MEVILKQDVAKLGYKDEIVKVKDGYANNFLLPKGFAIIATESARKMLAENLKQRAFKEDKIRKEATEMADKLNAMTGLKIATKAGENGKIYGSINTIQISDAIKNQFNLDVDRKKINIKGENIKELGSYKAAINVYKDIKAELSFDVVEE
ncbi:MAG: 50S ribosomal protein L9 [Bacteroidales bacterium]|jgi:large subunit ribosomal protein L9|nr:50S ribosomal protein L9 [Bacteroidales bacterium]